MVERVPDVIGAAHLTKNARNLVQVAVTLAGFDKAELFRRISAAAVRRSRYVLKTNSLTVENIMQAMREGR